MTRNKTRERKAGLPPGSEVPPMAKFEIYGEEMIEKQVSLSGKSGRVYLPQEWVGKSVKIIRVH